MKYALLLVKIQEDLPHDRAQALRNFEGSASDIAANTKGVSMHNQYCYELQLSDGWSALSSLLAQAKSWSIPVRVAFFDQPPVWVGETSLV